MFRCFINEKVRNDSPDLRWGGYFTRKDEVHIDDGITWLQTKRHLALASLRFHNALPLTEFVILLQDTIRSIASALNSHLASVGRILAEKILSVARASFPIDGLPGLYQLRQEISEAVVLKQLLGLRANKAIYWTI